MGFADQRLELEGPALAGRPAGAGGRPATPPVPSPSSTMEFHSPQPSHLPCQRAEAAPQFWQT